ncbi:MAG: TonB-dependent siderophore receptor [Pseudomonadota bacterium]|nr:TonB-dependent siderophore receptor [Pseudomonadota bacterium]
MPCPHTAATATAAECLPAAQPLLPADTFAPAFALPCETSGRLPRAALLGAVVGGALGLAPLAQAQQSPSAPIAQAQAPSQPQADTTLAPVTVTGEQESGSYQAPAAASSPKFTAPLLDTPKSVTVVPQELMQDRGATSLQDVLRTTPGITLGAGEGGTPNGDRPFVRGYEASTDIFVDGLRDYARGSHETFNLETVEIIKGPSSAYTGRGGTGGSINLKTKEPKRQRFVEASAGFGNASQWRTTLDGNLPFGETGAVRLNLMKMGGNVPGRGGVDIDRWGVAPSVAIGLGTPTRLTLSYAHIQNDDMPDQGIPFSNAARPDRTTPPNVDRDNFYGRLNTDFRENHFKTGTLKFEHDFSSALKLRNVTRHVETLNHYLLSRPSFDNCTATDTNTPAASCYTEGPDAQFTRGSRAWWRSSRSLINQTDLQGEFTLAGLKNRYSAGLEFSQEKIYNRDISGTPRTVRDSLYHPNPHRDYSYALEYGPYTPAGRIRTTSAYVMNTLEFNPQWQLNTGLRRDIFRVTNYTDSRTDAFWNYQLGVVYKPVEYGSVYLSFGTSSNPAGENLGQGGGADGVAGAAQIRNVKPERSRSWELGTKWDVLNQRLSLTAAIFETRKTDARSTDPLTGEVTLGGNNRVRGLELGASGSITPQWNLWAGYTYLDPKVIRYRSGNNVFDGNQIKFIAKHSASLWTTYKVLPNLTVGGGATYMGMRYANDANSLKLPSWVRWDAMARYDVNRQLSVQLNLNNIGNKPLYDASHVGLFASVAPGRSVMLTANYRFD